MTWDDLLASHRASSVERPRPGAVESVEELGRASADRAFGEAQRRFVAAIDAHLAKTRNATLMLYVHGSVYYGVGWYDPYYYGGGYGGDVVVVPNPPDRPDRPVTQPRPTPLPATGAPSRPSIPAAPRPSGGGRRR
jgi:hypothetical protein